MAELDDATRAIGLADQAFARFDVEAMITHLSAAIRGFTAAGEPCQAAIACVRLGQAMTNFLGNQTAGRAWFARATRLVEDLPPCLEQGWVALAAMGCDVDDPAVLLAHAEFALDRARLFGDLNLETKALADAGLAHVQAGRVALGMGLLDEAMALACGPADDADAAARSVCSFFTACYFALDFERANTWSDLLRRHGLIGPEPPGPAFLSGHCDSVQATMLMELGRWGQAEAVLLRAKADFEAALASPSWHPDIALADLRIRQGRHADAEALLLGKEQSMQALLPLAHLHLARGDHDLALITAGRGLRLIGDDRLRATELLAVQVDAHLARGDVESALAACDALADRAGGVDIAALRARGDAARGRVLASMGDIDGAIALVGAAIEGLEAVDLPWLRVSLQLELARLHERSGDRAAAVRGSIEAARTLTALDVMLGPADVALLERLVTPTTVGRHEPPPAALSRDGRWWVASWSGTTVRIGDSKGMQYLAELVRVPGAERHALDLVDRVEGVGGTGQPDRRSLGDAGEMLDGRARTAYRHRVEALRGEIEDALGDERLEAAEALQEELDQLMAQLAKAFGLGGRTRVAGSAAERARLNVTRALRAALARLADALPDAGATLDRRVRTGLYCAYEPHDGEVRWIVQS
ncbi:MAG TPA: hypothetical protein VM030_02500 [Acidimicrobiales bacterium]|nr:hypothetical protein [Acidimicrobiales bacterium]